MKNIDLSQLSVFLPPKLTGLSGVINGNFKGSFDSRKKTKSLKGKINIKNGYLSFLNLKESLIEHYPKNNKIDFSNDDDDHTKNDMDMI